MPRQSRAYPDDYFVKLFESTGSFAKGTEFTRDKPFSTQGWKVHCPICAVDEYTINGLCTGVFQSYCNRLVLGQRPCRCHVGFRYTPEQREYQVKKTFADEGLNYKFVGWVGEARSGRKARIRIDCLDHGEFTPPLDSYLNAYKTRCPGCATHGFKPDQPASFYVVRTTAFTGYGITCDVKYRMGLHRKHLHRDAEDCIKEVLHFPMIGYDARTLEDEVRVKFPLFSTRVRGFVREATDLELFEDVVSYAESFHDKISDVQWKTLPVVDFMLGRRSLRQPYSLPA